MKIDESMKLDSQLCFPLYAAARKITGLYTPYLKPLDIHPVPRISGSLGERRDHGRRALQKTEA